MPSQRLIIAIALLVACHVSSTLKLGVDAFHLSSKQPARSFAIHSIPEPRIIPQLDEWRILENGRVQGKVVNHPDILDGSVISTSPLANPSATREMNLVETLTGSQYYLLTPSTALKTPESPLQDEQGMSESKKLMQKVKDAGIAGVISYAFWEFGFWTLSVPVCAVAYRQVTGHWPDFSDQEDLKKVGAEAFAFVNVARFAVPLRIGLALSTTPWVQRNVVDKFTKKDNNPNNE